MLNRRKFLKFTGLIGLAPLVANAQDSEDVEVFKTFPANQIRVVQSATNESSTLITVLAHRQAEIEIEVFNSQNGDPLIFAKEIIDLKLGDFLIYQLHIVGLVPGINYELVIHNRTFKEEHKKVFRSLDWNNKDIKLAIVSCSNHRIAKSKEKMFNQLFQTNPDVIFFAGDLVYANSSLDTAFGRPAEVAEAYAIYTKSLMEFEIYSRKQLIPIFASWDDHDLAFNNSDTFHPYKEKMLEIFRTFFPVDLRIKGIVPGPGTSFAMNAFGMQIVFLDSRYHKNDKAEQFLGFMQFSWLRLICRTNSSPKMLISSQQFWNYRSLAESYQNNAEEEFNEFLDEVKKWSSPALFISGDVHYSQIQEIPASYVGYKTFEITSSALFSSSARSFGKRSPQDGQSHYYGYPNFLLLEDIQGDSNFLKLSVTCVSETSFKQFSRKISIQKSFIDRS